jgi:hypothetical protein
VLFSLAWLHYSAMSDKNKLYLRLFAMFHSDCSTGGGSI